MVSCSVAECCTPPEVPVITTLNVFVVVKVNCWVALPAVFVAVKVTCEVLEVVAVPARTPPPDEFAVKLTPFGRLPLSVTVGVGVPVVVTVNELAIPPVNVALFALVNTGAWPGGGGGGDEDPPHAACNSSAIVQEPRRSTRAQGGTFLLETLVRKQKHSTPTANPKATENPRYRELRDPELIVPFDFPSISFFSMRASVGSDEARVKAFDEAVGIERLIVTALAPGVTLFLLN